MSFKMNKSKLNLIIDIIMFVVLMAIAGIGFMIKYVLIPGFKRNEIYGKDVELYFYNLDRHQWGTIHLILSFALLFLLLLHIIFHWNQIVSIFKRLVPQRTWRIVTTFAILLLSFVFGVMPLFIIPEIQAGISHHTENWSQGSHQNTPSYSSSLERTPMQSQKKITDTLAMANSKTEQAKNNSGKPKNVEQREDHTVEIKGYMTLNDVAKKYNIEVNDLALVIHIPVEYSNETLGRLRKQYGFQMEELRSYIEHKIQ